MKALVVIALLAAVLAGCGDSSSTTTDPVVVGSTTTSASPATTTVPESTTTTTTTTTTTAPPTTTEPPPTTSAPPEYSVATYGLFPDPLPGSDEAHGSGCTVDGSELPDGLWFGFVVAAAADVFTFDLACFWTGEAAVAAATADGEEEVFDFYIRNANARTRTAVGSPDGTAYWLDSAGDLTPQPTLMTDWPVVSETAYQDCPSQQCAVWLYMNDGVVTELVEQYLP